MIVVKIGGGAGLSLAACCDDVARLRASGVEVVVVHGGSDAASQLGVRLGQPPRFITAPSGVKSRYTDAATLEVFTMALGAFNAQVVAALQERGVDAIGLCGPDGRVLEGKRKEAVVSVEEGRKRVVRDDFSGSVEKVNAPLLRALLAAGHTPVICPPALSPDGPINVDADRAAALVASTLQADTLVLLTNVEGLLRDQTDPTSLVDGVTLDTMDEALVHAGGRMKIKVIAAREAVTGGVARAIIADGRRAAPVDAALSGLGTVVTATHDRTGETVPGRDTARPAPAHVLANPAAIARGLGVELWDESGRRYLDCVGGQGSANLGHCHPRVVAAIQEQAATLITCTTMLDNSVRDEFLARLASVMPDGLDRFFLCNSGTEAVEAAIKAARLATGRSGIIAAKRGFHGRTLGALSTTWERTYREPFEPLGQHVVFVPYNDIAALDAALDDSIGLVLLEPIQGEGGVHPAEPGYLGAAAQLCRDRGAIFALDEVQTGFGRTGTMFACQDEGVTPDLLCLAKSIAGGVPMGALAFGPRVPSFGPGAHGSTFGGSPLACAAGLAALGALVDERLPENARDTGAYLRERISALDAPGVRAVRGRGLMIGLELRGRARPVVAALRERDVLSLTAGLTVLRLLPPLVITRGQCDEIVAALDSALQEVFAPATASEQTRVPVGQA